LLSVEFLNSSLSEYMHVLYVWAFIYIFVGVYVYVRTVYKIEIRGDQCCLSPLFADIPMFLKSSLPATLQICFVCTFASQLNVR
jgi:hypothetical protein